MQITKFKKKHLSGNMYFFVIPDFHFELSHPSAFFGCHFYDQFFKSTQYKNIVNHFKGYHAMNIT